MLHESVVYFLLTTAVGQVAVLVGSTVLTRRNSVSCYKLLSNSNIERSEYNIYLQSKLNGIWYTKSEIIELYFSQKQLPRKMKSRLVIIMCAGYIFRQLFLWRL